MLGMEKEIYERICKVKGRDKVGGHAPVRYKELMGELRLKERARQDILHMIELLDDLTDDEYKELSKEVRKVQKERRKIKDELEYYKELVELTKDDIKITFKLIRETLGKVTERMEERLYFVREREDLAGYIRGIIRLSDK